MHKPGKNSSKYILVSL